MRPRIYPEGNPVAIKRTMRRYSGDRRGGGMGWNRHTQKKISNISDDESGTETFSVITPDYEYEYEYLYFGNIYDMAMKIKFIIYAPGNRNYGYYRLHFGYQIIIYIYIYNINDRHFEINVD